ncbi:MAG: hypothetical protein CMI04_15845, partial [Oceanospirillaceae bacterium]|nr:hypothetical protein [Oceanospirillaceae bacterium]
GTEIVVIGAVVTILEGKPVAGQPVVADEAQIVIGAGGIGDDHAPLHQERTLSSKVKGLFLKGNSRQ